jgi:hypothetical protein
MPLDRANPSDFDALVLPGGALNVDFLRVQPQGSGVRARAGLGESGGRHPRTLGRFDILVMTTPSLVITSEHVAELVAHLHPRADPGGDRPRAQPCVAISLSTSSAS